LDLPLKLTGVKNKMVLEKMIVSIVVIVVGVILLTATAATIQSNTATGATKALENVSATAKVIYGLYDFLYALLGLGLIIGGFAGFFISLKQKGK